MLSAAKEEERKSNIMDAIQAGAPGLRAAPGLEAPPSSKAGHVNSLMAATSGLCEQRVPINSSVPPVNNNPGLEPMKVAMPSKVGACREQGSRQEEAIEMQRPQGDGMSSDFTITVSEDVLKAISRAYQLPVPAAPPSSKDVPVAGHLPTQAMCGFDLEGSDFYAQYQSMDPPRMAAMLKQMPQQVHDVEEKSERTLYGVKDDRQDGLDELPTTVMLRAIPNRYTQEDLMKEIEAQGFGGTFNYLYCPRVGKAARQNISYAFINFIRNEHLVQFIEVFHLKYTFTKHRRSGSAGKKVAVSIARIQGLEASLQQYEENAEKLPPADRAVRLQRPYVGEATI
eukprot:TRINITY_DN36713_c0_g1_i2.p1 TRINITY_DN36713_c0_g1~~TRINITY_DN36713_c0_g1_i2.p1  ORF type:complete len:340 (+),score=82.05 TRINITY_DN36713_c0_g1_i2:763-1782(+)